MNRSRLLSTHVCPQRARSRLRGPVVARLRVLRIAVRDHGCGPVLAQLEADRNRKRRELFNAQDAIDAQRDELIGRIEKRLRQRHALKPVFTFRWRLA